MSIIYPNCLQLLCRQNYEHISCTKCHGYFELFGNFKGHGLRFQMSTNDENYCCITILSYIYSLFRSLSYSLLSE